MIYKQFDIVKIPFLFTDKNKVKKRPALIISIEQYQEKYLHCILIMITTAKYSSWEDDIYIEDLAKAGLTSESKIRFKIFSIEADLIISKLGELTKNDIYKVKQVISKFIAT
jgi:mRNA interferase MazF